MLKRFWRMWERQLGYGTARGGRPVLAECIRHFVMGLALANGGLFVYPPLGDSGMGWFSACIASRMGHSRMESRWRVWGSH
jgi:hypothetical protein